ncbi:MAG: nicotinamide riboside kinase [Arenicella sp.]|jgi:nicotinamide riboside kinase
MIKIAITGPECSGKSTLAMFLGKKLGVNWIPEYARSYIDLLNRPYNQEDLDIIARKQQMMIDGAKKSSIKYLIVDTEMLVLKIWSQEKFGEVSLDIESFYGEQDFDLIVLCKPDIPFEEDKQRENPADRDRLFEIYLADLENSGRKYITVSGSILERIDLILDSI